MNSRSPWPPMLPRLKLPDAPERCKLCDAPIRNLSNSNTLDELSLLCSSETVSPWNAHYRYLKRNTHNVFERFSSGTTSIVIDTWAGLGCSERIVCYLDFLQGRKYNRKDLVTVPTNEYIKKTLARVNLFL